MQQRTQFLSQNSLNDFYPPGHKQSKADVEQQPHFQDSNVQVLGGRKGGGGPSEQQEASALNFASIFQDLFGMQQGREHSGHKRYQKKNDGAGNW